MLYGDADAATHLTEKFRLEGVGKTDGVTKVADKLADFCRKEYKKAKDVPMTRLPSFGLTIAGLDAKRGTYQIPRCYTMHSTSAFLLEFCKPYAIHGKDMIAQYLFRRQFVEDMTVAKLSELVARTIYDTKAIDGDVGGRIRVAIIASDGFREKQRAEVRQLLRQALDDPLGGAERVAADGSADDERVRPGRARQADRDRAPVL